MVKFSLSANLASFMKISNRVIVANNSQVLVLAVIGNNDLVGKVMDVSKQFSC